MDYTGNGNTCPLGVVCNATDMEVNIVHLAKLLCRLFVVGSRLAVELYLMVTVLSLNTVRSHRKNSTMKIQLTRALL